MDVENGGYMDELFAFLQQEISLALDEIIEIKEKIRTLNHDINTIEVTANKMDGYEDKTKNIFTAVEKENSFATVEYQNLINRKNEMTIQKNEYCVRLDSINSRYKQLLKISDEVNAHMERYSEYESDRNSRLEFLKINENNTSNFVKVISNEVINNIESVVAKNNLVLNTIKSDPQRAIIEIKNNNSIIKRSLSKLDTALYELIPVDCYNPGLEASFYMLMDKLSHKTNVEYKYLYNGEDIINDDAFVVSIIKLIKYICDNILIVNSLNNNSLNGNVINSSNVASDSSDKKLIVTVNNKDEKLYLTVKSDLFLKKDTVDNPYIKEILSIYNGRYKINNKEDMNCIEIIFLINKDIHREE